MMIMLRCRRATAGAIWALAGLFFVASPALAQFCPPQCPAGKILLGVAGPMSGQFAAFGQQTANAAMVSIAKLNAAGGLLGLPVALAIGDDRCDRGRTIDVAKRHVENDKISAVIGPACPAAALTASQVYANAGIVQFAPSVVTVDLTRQGLDSVFRMLANVEQEAQAYGRFFANENSGKKLVVVFTEDFYGRMIADNLRRALPADAKALTRFEPVLDTSVAFDRVAEKLQRESPDAIALALETGTSVELIKRLHQHGVRSQLLGGQQLLSQSFWFAARELAEGIQVLAPIKSLSDPAFRTVIDQLFEAKVVPDLVAMSSFAAVQTWAEAVRRAGSGDPKAVIATLRSGEFDTAIGRIAFDPRGDRRDIQYSVFTWRNGRLAQ